MKKKLLLFLSASVLCGLGIAMPLISIATKHVDKKASTDKNKKVDIVVPTADPVDTNNFWINDPGFQYTTLTSETLQGFYKFEDFKTWFETHKDLIKGHLLNKIFTLIPGSVQLDGSKAGAYAIAAQNQLNYKICYSEDNPSCFENGGNYFIDFGVALKGSTDIIHAFLLPIEFTQKQSIFGNFKQVLENYCDEYASDDNGWKAPGGPHDKLEGFVFSKDSTSKTINNIVSNTAIQTKANLANKNIIDSGTVRDLLIFKIGELDNDFSDKEDNDILADTNLKNEIKRKLYDMLVKKGILEPSDNSGKQLINFNQIDLTNACDLPYFKESKDLVADYNRRSGNLWAIDDDCYTLYLVPSSDSSDTYAENKIAIFPNLVAVQFNSKRKTIQNNSIIDIEGKRLVFTTDLGEFNCKPSKGDLLGRLFQKNEEFLDYVYRHSNESFTNDVSGQWFDPDNKIDHHNTLTKVFKSLMDKQDLISNREAIQFDNEDINPNFVDGKNTENSSNWSKFNYYYTKLGSLTGMKKYKITNLEFKYTNELRDKLDSNIINVKYFLPWEPLLPSYVHRSYDLLELGVADDEPLLIETATNMTTAVNGGYLNTIFFPFNETADNKIDDADGHDTRLFKKNLITFLKHNDDYDYKDNRPKYGLDTQDHNFFKGKNTSCIWDAVDINITKTTNYIKIDKGDNLIYCKDGIENYSIYVITFKPKKNSLIYCNPASDADVPKLYYVNLAQTSNAPTSDGQGGDSYQIYTAKNFAIKEGGGH